ncbi:helix-turn-helix domain-containing protein [Pseudonocardia sp. TRM90224]|uniref:helix-turn-helix domain-containing protein n=1 Tax=Pseudonocardia sp. TRM90224 TaxID=2812678 RepID=UPI001E454221|nr:helix-turn-helix domain-containing protein [Pseudonocardia sp. TRM90224]
MSDNPLGEFLRACREAVTPIAAGLPSGPRRRTPGLRREELAELAGVSVEYLTRLERGRDRRPSPEVLAALARALKLRDDEHVHLLRLVKTSGGRTCAAAAAREPVRPTLRLLLDQLDPTPAVLIDMSGEVLACTEGFRKLAGPAGVLDAASIPRFVFTDPRARTTFPDWGQVAEEWAARLRSAADLADPHAADVAAELALTPGSDFAERYAAATRVPRWTGTERWRHPDRGELHLGYEALAVPGTDEHRVLVYLG